MISHRSLASNLRGSVYIESLSATPTQVLIAHESAIHGAGKVNAAHCAMRHRTGRAGWATVKGKPSRAIRR
jgi:hypothetical protein